MAEARSMVRFGLPERRPSDYLAQTSRHIKSNIWPEGDTPVQVAMSTAKALRVIVRTRLRRIRRAVFNAVFPSSSYSWYICVGTAGAVNELYPWTIKKTLGILPFNISNDIVERAVSAVVGGTALFVSWIYTTRTCLRILLHYRGFLYDHPKRTSLKTKLWIVAVRLMEGFGRPMTYSFQGVLPRLPVPPLQQTISKYLKSMKPLLDEAEYARMERLADEFRSGVGKNLQRYLVLKSWTSPNYVSDWWERFVYLRSRAPLAINSNFYIMDAYTWKPTNNQIARAANLVHHFMVYKKRLDRGHIEPLLIQGAVPLCMYQYERSFGTSRIPGDEEDEIVHNPSSRHVAVLCKGHYYIFNLIGDNGVQLSPRDIEKQLQYIVEDAEKAPAPTTTERHLAVMTAADRSEWAAFRTTHVTERTTRASLDAVERAVLFLVLDDFSPETEADLARQTDRVAGMLLHGSGSNIWFDKSLTLLVFKNARAGVNVEHSWADAPVGAHAWEYVLALEFAGTGYDNVSGMNKAVPYPKSTYSHPLRLRWNFDEEVTAPIVTRQLDDYRQRIADLDQRVVAHDAYSKGFIKSCKVSPDAWFQAALQLAYYRDQGHFTQTYEASMTRLYLHGRTETVRSVTNETCDFVRAMVKGCTKDHGRDLLRKAADVHVGMFRDAMAGKGVDRHLFALYVVSKWKNADVPFLKEALSVEWRLSTSQTPPQQTKLFDLQNNLNKISSGGGFGPVADDGYGVSYIISSDQAVFFHVTSKKNSPKTDSTRFGDHIVQALADMKELFTDS